jgi:gas vesicle protein
MSDNTLGRNDRGSLAPMIAFAMGAVVGGVVALLLAPASGEKTRRRIGDTARRVTGDVRKKFDQTRDAATHLGADLKSAIDAGREALGHDAEPHEHRSMARIGEKLNPLPHRTP